MTKRSKAQQSRALARSGLPDSSIAEMVGTSRQAVADAKAVAAKWGEAEPKRGRPRKPGKKRCPTCGHVIT